MPNKISFDIKKKPLFTYKGAPVFIRFMAGLYLASGIIALILGSLLLYYSIGILTGRIWGGLGGMGVLFYFPWGTFSFLWGVFAISIAYGLSYLKKWVLILLTLTFPLSFIGGLTGILGIILLVYCWKNKELFRIKTFKPLIISLIIGLMPFILLAGLILSILLKPTKAPEGIKEAPEEEIVREITEGKIYSPIELNPEIKGKLDKKLSEISEIYQEAKKNPDLTDTIIFIFSKSFGFEYQNNKYIVSFDYSGGAHCCGDAYVFRLDENNELNLLKPSAPIRVGGNIFPLELEEKHDRLYLVTTDDRFAYYPGSYAGSPFFKRYFLIERDSLILANIDWEEEFIKAAQKAEDELKNLYEEVKATPGKYFGWEIWTRPLIEKTVNYMVAQKNEKAWEGFDEFFDKFSFLIAPPEGVTKEKVREDILKIMESVPYLGEETISWKTYRNEEYGFEMKYPLDWTVGKKDQSLVFYKISDLREFGGMPFFPIYIKKEDNPQQLSFTQWIEQKGIKAVDVEPIIIDELPSVRFWEVSITKHRFISVFISKGTTVYELSYNFDDYFSEYMDIFNQMLSTFRFLK